MNDKNKEIKERIMIKLKTFMREKLEVWPSQKNIGELESILNEILSSYRSTLVQKEGRN